MPVSRCASSLVNRKIKKKKKGKSYFKIVIRKMADMFARYDSLT